MSGTIFVVSGVNDTGLVSTGWTRGLRSAGLPHVIEQFTWQQCRWWSYLTYADLWRVGYHHRQAAKLADRLRAARASGSVHVFAHSAGTAIAAYALAQLAPNETITSAVFVASGLSAGFDLAPALVNCDAGILSVECGTDVLTLGLGTSLLGTCDRRWRPAAGLTGFRPPANALAYQKLHSLRWSWRHLKAGWIGGHIFSAVPGFARTVLADWVLRAEAQFPAATIP
jgi:pimeloyl-ACP methyl ester carboxylesterase